MGPRTQIKDAAVSSLGMDVEGKLVIGKVGARMEAKRAGRMLVLLTPAIKVGLVQIRTVGEVEGQGRAGHGKVFCRML